MRGMRYWVKLGGLAVSMGVLAACGPTTTATNTVPAAATTAATTRAATTTTGAAVTTARTTTAAPAGTTRTAAPATATRPASPLAGTAVRPGSPTATRVGSPTVVRTGSPTTGAVPPNLAVLNLQRLDSSRQAWNFAGFTVGGFSGNLSPVYEYNSGNQKVTASAGGTSIEAYLVGGNFFVQNPLGGGYIQADSSNPLAAPVQALFAAPNAILTNLIPASANFTRAGTETVNGQQTTKYTANVELANLGFVNPALQGQRGTAATQVWVDNSRGYIVALESNITGTGVDANTRARLDVTNVGQVPPITVPGR